MNKHGVFCVAVWILFGGSLANGQTVAPADIAVVQDAQYNEIEQYLDGQIAEANRQRIESWKRDLSGIEAYEKSIEPYRQKLFDLLGGNVYAAAPLNPRVELVAEFPNHKAYRVWVGVFDQVTSYGILLVPNGTGPFPALICVHGMEGTPEGVCGLTEQADYHNRFGLQAVERGYIALAPLDLNNAKKRNWLDRKAIMVGQRLQALEQYKMTRLVEYLASRADVNAERIGAYGISWGGRTVMNLAALDRRVAACAISGHFNDLVPKMIAPSPNYTAYIETPENYAFFSNHARTFTDADVVSLICPRPVFIEQGRADRVAYWEMSQKAFEEARQIYQALGVGERAEFSIFEGGHEVRGVEAFAFFDRWLKAAP